MLHATHQHRLILFVIDLPDHRPARETDLIILAQTTIEGNLYIAISATSAQPRIGSDNCIPCRNGTWANANGQRLVIVYHRQY